MTQVSQTYQAPVLSFDVFHCEVGIGASLFESGHYDDAVRKTSQRFINRVGEFVDRPDLDGVALINKVFPQDAPLLQFSDRVTPTERSEHNGFRALAIGLTQAVRNVFTHRDNYGLDAVQALEWLAFLSAMHRRLDQARQTGEL